MKTSRSAQRAGRRGLNRIAQAKDGDVARLPVAHQVAAPFTGIFNANFRVATTEVDGQLRFVQGAFSEAERGREVVEPGGSFLEKALPEVASRSQSRKTVRAIDDVVTSEDIGHTCANEDKSAEQPTEPQLGSTMRTSWKPRVDFTAAAGRFFDGLRRRHIERNRDEARRTGARMGELAERLALSTGFAERIRRTRGLRAGHVNNPVANATRK